MKKPMVHITDHAVIRYLERVRGVDIEAVRREIRAKVTLAQDYPGATGILVDGFRYALANGAVVTIHDIGQSPARAEAEAELDDAE